MKLGDRALQNLRDFVAEPEPGDVIADRYELGQRIGEGGMGVVYAGVDRSTGREVAVKIVSLGGQRDGERFEREATALARAVHPAIVSYSAHGMHAGAAYLVMDRLRGATLAERMARASSAPSIREAIAIVRQLADGLAVAHAAGITHRDIKPSNVFLVDDSPERARLLDFGLARLSDAATLTDEGALVGTPGYMAPEQVRGERAGSAADVFALGCVLYECVAKRAPFLAEGTDVLHAQVLLEQPSPLDAVAPKAPKALAEIVARMMNKDAAERPPADEVARALEAIAADLPADPPIAAGPGLEEGRVIAGKYRIEQRLGEGGMGIVVAAKHLDLGTLVALKLMRGTDRDDHARFLREARAVSRLESEHVARVLDFGRTDDATPFIVMEYLNGVDLARRLRERGPLPVAKAVDCVLQACEAIAEAHALGIVHRDLKPSNLFLVTRRDRTEMVKVLDFGISKMTGARGEASNDTVTDAKVVLGSIAYMSPEQLQRPTEVGPRTDVWALGVVLYELVTGARPFEGESAAAIGARIAAAKAPRLRDARADAPAALEAAVLRCLEKDPAARFADLAELARALAPFGSENSRAAVDRVARLLGDAAAPAAPDSAHARSRVPVAAMGLAAFAVGVLAVRFFLVQPSTPARDDAKPSTSASVAVTAPDVVPSASAQAPSAVASSAALRASEPQTASAAARPPLATSSAPRPSVARPPASLAGAPSSPRPASSTLDLRDPALEGR